MKSYTAYVSAWKYKKELFISLLFFWSLIGLIIFFVILAGAKKEKYEFNGLSYSINEGLFIKKTVDRRISTVMAVNVSKSIFGKIFNYGEVHCQGDQRMGYAFDYVKNPEGLKEYLLRLSNEKSDLI